VISLNLRRWRAFALGVGCLATACRAFPDCIVAEQSRANRSTQSTNYTSAKKHQSGRTLCFGLDILLSVWGMFGVGTGTLRCDPGQRNHLFLFAGDGWFGSTFGARHPSIALDQGLWGIGRSAGSGESEPALQRLKSAFESRNVLRAQVRPDRQIPDRYRKFKAVSA